MNVIETYVSCKIENNHLVLGPMGYREVKHKKTTRPYSFEFDLLK